jgi:hypothetical protein
MPGPVDPTTLEVSDQFDTKENNNEKNVFFIIACKWRGYDVEHPPSSSSGRLALA